MGRSPNTDEDDMAKKVNASALGAFVLGAIALLVAAVVLFGSGKFFHKTFPYVMYFQGSVGGLSIGADVTFKGVRIGSVKSVRLETDLKDMSFSIPVIIELDPNLIGVQGGTTAEGQKLDNEARNELIKRLIKKGLRAELKQVSFVTGELQVTLDFFPDTPVRLVGNGSMMEIPTKQSTIEELTETVRQLPLQELVNKVIRTVDGIDKFMNSRDMQNIPQKVNGVMDEAGSLVKSIKQEVVPALEKLNDTLQSYQDLAQHVDRKGRSADGTVYTGVADQLKAKIGDLVAAARQYAADSGRRAESGQIHPAAAGAYRWFQFRHGHGSAQDPGQHFEHGEIHQASGRLPRTPSRSAHPGKRPL